jgi:hypothetical protein
MNLLSLILLQLLRRFHRGRTGRRGSCLQHPGFRIERRRSLRELRHVPTNQIFGFDLSTDIEMSRTRRTVCKSWRKHSTSRSCGNWFELVPATNGQRAFEGGEESSIVTSCFAGVPVRIAEDPPCESVGKMCAQLRRNVAAVDSELAPPPRSNNISRSAAVAEPALCHHQQSLISSTNGILMVTVVRWSHGRNCAGSWTRPWKPKQTVCGDALISANISDPAYKLGDDIMRNAADFARRWGFETWLIPTPPRFHRNFR